MKERLLLFLAHLEMGQTKFETNVGLSRGYIVNLKGDMKLDTINKILSTYPELSREWLMHGEGEMLKTNISNSQNKNIQDSNIGSKNIQIGDNTGSVHIGGNGASTAGMNREELLELINDLHMQYTNKLDERFAYVKQKEFEIMDKDAAISRRNKVIDRKNDKIDTLLAQIGKMQDTIDKLTDKLLNN